MATSTGPVFLMGEYPMVVEMGETLHQHGIEFMCRVDIPPGAQKLPPYFRKSVSMPRRASVCFELSNLNETAKRKNLSLLDKTFRPPALIISSSVTTSISRQAGWMRHPSRLVGLGALPTLLRQPLAEIAFPIDADNGTIAKTREFFVHIGKEVSVIQDRAGMVMPRILCALINEAFFAVMQGIASAADVDVAMKLGTNYPSGPIEWANRIGLEQVQAVLHAIRDETGEERYRTAPLLEQMAARRPWWNG